MKTEKRFIAQQTERRLTLHRSHYPHHKKATPTTPPTQRKTLYSTANRKAPHSPPIALPTPQKGNANNTAHTEKNAKKQGIGLLE
ncbi:hypothetical protein KVE47_00950 [Helicobacter pylori]|nr:hypothetical protein KVE47_00950 [Helicobacter pylori]